MGQNMKQQKYFDIPSLGRSLAALRLMACVSSRILHYIGTILLILLFARCDDNFDDFNVVTDFRLLAMQADPPALREGETTTLRALVSDTSATYHWSWCPIPGDSDAGFPCVLTHGELQAIVDEELGEGAITVPSFHLGSEPTAIFDYSFPPELLAGACAILSEIDLPDIAPAPRCASGTFPIVIKLTVNKDGKTITGVHDLLLRYAEGTPTNNIPVMDGLSLIVNGERKEIPDGGGQTLTRGTEHELLISVGETASESYSRERDGGVEVLRENLTATWFIEGGETEKRRTSFIAGEKPMADLVTNKWKTPTENEFPRNDMRVFVVLRDNRGGISWLQRNIVLENR